MTNLKAFLAGAGVSLAGLSILVACEPPIVVVRTETSVGQLHRRDDMFSLAPTAKTRIPIPYRPDVDEVQRVLPTLAQGMEAAEVAVRLGFLTWPDLVYDEQGNWREFYALEGCSAVEVLFRSDAGGPGRLWLAASELGFP